MESKQNNLRLLAVDLDGTLLTDDKRISEANLAALRAAMEQGIHVCLATGRAWPGARAYAECVGPDTPVVTNNGAMIVDPRTDEILFELQLAREDAKEIYALGESLGISMVVWSQNILYGSRMDALIEDYEQRFGKMKARPVTSIDELSKQGISKILWYSMSGQAVAWSKLVPESIRERVSVETSSVNALEFFNRNVSKAQAVGRVAEGLGLSLSDTMAIGDAGNDLPLIKAAGLGVAMGNAMEHVKAMADAVTADNEHDGVMEAVRRYLLK